MPWTRTATGDRSGSGLLSCFTLDLNWDLFRFYRVEQRNGHFQRAVVIRGVDVVRPHTFGQRQSAGKAAIPHFVVQIAPSFRSCSALHSKVSPTERLSRAMSQYVNLSSNQSRADGEVCRHRAGLVSLPARTWQYGRDNIMVKTLQHRVWMLCVVGMEEF